MIFLIVIIILLAGAPVEASGLTSTPPDKQASEWKMVEESGDIRIFERWIQVSDDLKVRERKGVFTVNASVEQVVALICNTGFAATWMKGVSESSVIRKLSDTEWYTYTVYSIPWPFSDYDIVSRYTLSDAATGSGVMVSMVSEEGVLPEKQNVQRLKNYQASWEVVRAGDDLTRITFFARSDEPPAFPRWIQDPIILKAFICNLANLQELLNTELALKESN